MKVKVKQMDIKTGGVLVAVLHKHDAEMYDLYSLDRIKIIKGKKIETVVVDISQSDHIVSSGTIAVFKEVSDSLNLKDGSTVQIKMARKPLSIDFIKKKLDGERLSKDEIYQIIWDVVHNKLNDIELTYFVSACYTNPLDDIERVHLIKAMTEEGQILKVNRYPILDKHCIGGVAGNRTSMLLVPILAACGCTIPKTSSRSITSPAGTADTMEVLCDVSLDLPKMKDIVEEHNGCLVWGGALNLAPSDDKIINVEKPMMIDAESQLIASIVSKKLSVSSTHILIDIPVGRGAKIEAMSKAKKLKKAFEKVSRQLDINIKAIITDGSQPIGYGIGPALEARDVLYVLLNDKRQPFDLRDKACMMAGILLEMAGKAKKFQGKKMAEEVLSSGKAYGKMIEILEAQGKRVDHPDEIEVSHHTYTVRANSKGTIMHIDNHMISKIARIAGAPMNHHCGIMFHQKVHENVEIGDELFTIYAGSKNRLKNAVEVLKTMYPYEIRL
ncbi:MAG: AMP phosphorylase [Candidatus Woesearchaeota archaeon]